MASHLSQWGFINMVCMTFTATKSTVISTGKAEQ